MTTKLSFVLTGVLLSVACAVTARAATSDQAGSILIFPRVVADAEHDTFFQIVNRSNLKTHATCFYVRVAGAALQDVDWTIALEPKQSTHWSATRGRALDPNDPACFGNNAQADCYGAGFDPGAVPPAVADFAGEMVCVQTDASGAPASGNALAGVADVIGVGDGSTARYSAFAIRGFDDNNNDGELCIGQAAAGSCAVGAEYEPCPARWMLVHPSDGQEDDASETATLLTIVGCDQDLLSQTPRVIDLDVFVTNEFEQRFRLATRITGGQTIALSDFSPVFHRDVTGELLFTDLVSPDQRGFVVVAEIERSDANGSASLATNLYGDPTLVGADTLRVSQ